MARGPVKLERYNSDWENLYEKYATEIKDSLKELVQEIEHIGSTAIEGLSAKPIIDIGITTDDVENPAIIDAMEKIGYEYVDKYETEFPFRRYFVLKSKEEEGEHLVHVHIVPKNHEFFMDHIIFRDFLRNNRDIKDEYHFLKTRLANKYRNDREGYQKGKNEFINRIMELAKEEN